MKLLRKLRFQKDSRIWRSQISPPQKDTLAPAAPVAGLGWWLLFHLYTEPEYQLVVFELARLLKLKKFMVCVTMRITSLILIPIYPSPIAFWHWFLFVLISRSTTFLSPRWSCRIVRKLRLWGLVLGWSGENWQYRNQHEEEDPSYLL